MRFRQLLRSLAIALSVPAALTLGATSIADTIDDAEDLPATPAEERFIGAFIDSIDANVPAIDGWQRDVGVTASGNTVHEDKKPMIYSRAREFPLKLSFQVKFRETTASDRQEAADEKTAEQLQQEMMEAAMSGDQKRMDEIQQQLTTMMRRRMEGGAMGQAAGVAQVPKEDPAEFFVAVIVNGEGESIGKNYDHDVPGVTKAFRVDKGSDDFLSYKYYLGSWGLRELDARNWRVVEPAEEQTTANHLRALVLYINVYGDRQSVENYVSQHIRIDGLNQMVNYSE